MASSKVVTTNSDLPRDSSSSSSSSSSLSSYSSNSLSTLLLHLSDSDLHHHPYPTTYMDELLNSIYPSTTTPPPPPSSSDAPTPPPPPSSATTKTVDDVWKEIVAGTATGTHSHSHSQGDVAEGAGEGLEGMTLEDFLTKAGAVREEDVRGGVLPPPTPSSTSTTTTTIASQFAMPVEGSSSVEAFGNGVDGNVVGGVAASASGSGGGGGGGVGKGKRRAVEEPVDKATLQKQKRMIKNRESAARSRERKQAYTTELEYLVQQLEQENARLLSEEADKQRQRYKQLMECLIPIEERREPKPRLRRSNSVQSM